MDTKIEEYYIETEKIKRIFKTDNSMIISFGLQKIIEKNVYIFLLIVVLKEIEFYKTYKI